MLRSIRWKNEFNFFSKHLRCNFETQQIHLAIYYIRNWYAASFLSRNQSNVWFNHACLNCLITFRKTFMRDFLKILTHLIFQFKEFRNAQFRSLRILSSFRWITFNMITQYKFRRFSSLRAWQIAQNFQHLLFECSIASFALLDLHDKFKCNRIIEYSNWFFSIKKILISYYNLAYLQRKIDNDHFCDVQNYRSSQLKIFACYTK